MFMSIEIHGLYMCIYARNFEISLMRRGIVYVYVCTMHKNERSVHAQIISWQRRAEVKNSCFLVAVSLLQKTA